MVTQAQVNLNEPLDVAAKPTLRKSDLTPELSEASITLHGDYFRQLQGKCNRLIFWHPGSISLMVLVLSLYAFYLFFDLMVVSDSVSEFKSLVWKDKSTLVKLFPCIIVLFAFIGLASFFISEEFRSISDDLLKPAYLEQLYGFDLKKYSKLTSSNATPKELKFLNTSSKNTHLMLYRESAIAVITLKPLLDNSTETNFFVKITGLHIRKVFAKVDFETLLLEWALIRSREIFQDYVNQKKIKDVNGCKLTVLIDGYSFDKSFLTILENNSFRFIKEDSNLNPFDDSESTVLKFVSQRSLNKLFGLSRKTYGITLLTKNEGEDVLLDAAKSKASGTKGTGESTRNRRH